MTDKVRYADQNEAEVGDTVKTKTNEMGEVYWVGLSNIGTETVKVIWDKNGVRDVQAYRALEFELTCRGLNHVEPTPEPAKSTPAEPRAVAKEIEYGGHTPGFGPEEKCRYYNYLSVEEYEYNADLKRSRNRR